ncbi:PepSY-associated TM helix domain-containing protein [Muricoccus nepalensis]|nr:PepSY-associated TM helix domain-containing protein [Roseomonas nepalensis]
MSVAARGARPLLRLPAWTTVWFQIHWFIGITAGLVLMVVGVTGGLLSYQDEILRALNPGVLRVTPRPGPVLSPAELIGRIEAASGARVTSLGLAAAPDRPVRAFLTPRETPPPGARPRRELRYADPHDGTLLGTPVGEGFFRTTRELHRWLLAGAEGRIVVGVSTIALVLLSLTGLYLRWPRRVLSWRSWFRIDTRLRGRALLWRLHAVIGTWALPLYLLAGLTGLSWSFDWYRTALYDLTGAPRPGAEAGPPRAEGEGRAARRGPPLDVDAAWAVFRREGPAFSTAQIRPPAPGQPLRVTYVEAGAPHEDARSSMAVNAAGEVVEHRRYADQPLGHRLMGSMLALHSGSYFGPIGTALMMVASLAMPLFGVTGWVLYLGRRRMRRDAARRAGRPRRGAAEAPLAAPGTAGE